MTGPRAGGGRRRRRLWGLRGAGGNFGVALRLELRVFPLDRVVGGLLTFGGNGVREAFRRFRDVVAGSPRELSCEAGLAVDESLAPVLVVAPWYTGPKVDPDELHSLRSEPGLADDGVRAHSFLEQQRVFDSPYGENRHYWKGHFVRQLPDELIDELLQRVVALGRPPGGILIESLHGAPEDVDAPESAVGFSPGSVQHQRDRDLAGPCPLTCGRRARGRSRDLRLFRGRIVGTTDAAEPRNAEPVGMQRSYGVVWRQGDGPVMAGKLQLLPRELRLEGREGWREIPYEHLSGVHVGRSTAERLDGRPTLVVEQRGRDAVTIATVAQSSLVGEIAERLAALQLGAQTMQRLIVVVPLKPGSRDEARALLESGPPFDPEGIQGLDRHEVFLTSDEVVFVFEADVGADPSTVLLTDPDLWQAAADWRDHLAGPPRIGEDVFSWSRMPLPENVQYLPTPGPGDSDGGDVY